MNHVFYGLIAGHQQRRQLGRLLREAPQQLTVNVDLVALKASGICALVFDFDGVLAPHAAKNPLPETIRFLERALDVFGVGSVYILSNKPSLERLKWFNQYLPGIVFVGGVRKKPYPDGLLKISELNGCSPDQVALLDDRLMTGGLACLHAGATFIYITQPLTDFSTHPFKEFFFFFLRSFEALLARLAA